MSWSFQSPYAPTAWPRTSTFDFELTDDEMTRIAALDTGKTMFFDHHDPAMVKWLGGRRVD